MLGGEVLADLTDGGRAGLLRRLLTRGAFPEVGLANLHEQVAVGGPEWTPLGLGPATGADGAGLAQDW